MAFINTGRVTIFLMYITLLSGAFHFINVSYSMSDNAFLWDAEVVQQLLQWKSCAQSSSSPILKLVLLHPGI